MFKKILTPLLTLTLFGCTGSTTSTPSIDTSDWTLRTESNFTLATPPAYERITTANSSLNLDSDFIVAYVETRLDSVFKTTLAIHRETLRTTAESRTYALAIRDSASLLTDYTELSLTDTTISGSPTALSQFTFSSEASAEPLTVFQTALTSGTTAWVLTCTTRTTEGDSAACQNMLQSFTLQ